MKQKELYAELIDTAGKLGIKVRQEKGFFKSGLAEKDGEKIIVLNKSTPIESLLSVLVRCLLTQDIEDVYVKPVVRDYLDIEKERLKDEPDVEIFVDY